VVSGVSVACDPNFSQVGLLLHCDGVNLSTAFTDSSFAPNTMTTAGAAEISTVDPAFGTGAFVNTRASPYAVAAVYTPIVSGGLLDLGTGDWTVEGWYNVQGAMANQQIIIDLTNIATAGNWGLYAGASEGFRIYANQSGSGYSIYLQGFGNGVGVNSQVIALDSNWHHFAAVNQGGTYTVYVDGVSGYPQVPVGNIGTGTWCTVGTTPYLGPLQDLNWAGMLDEIRVTKGLARYTANFAPPTDVFGGQCIPDILGLLPAAANAAITGAGLTVGAVTSAASTYPTGTVGSQSVSGSVISYTVSTGFIQASAYGTFVNSWVGKAIQIANMPDIEPKIWLPVSDNSMRAK
jgi:hypothetical protein